MKKIILAFVLGFIIASGITVYAVTRLKAEEVSYSDKTVKDAIDDLYTKALISGDCVNGWYQLDDNASTSIGDKILDFAPSVFFITYYDKNLPAGGETWNGGTVYYNKAYSEDYVYWPNLFPGEDAAVTLLDKNFIIDNNLVLKDAGWNNIKVFYMACK